MTTQPTTKELWDAYQACAAVDPWSDETKKARAVYTRRINKLRKEKREANS